MRLSGISSVGRSGRGEATPVNAAVYFGFVVRVSQVRSLDGPPINQRLAARRPLAFFTLALYLCANV